MAAGIVGSDPFTVSFSMNSTSFATRWNADLIESNYRRWLDQPDALDANWQAFFEGFELARSLNEEIFTPAEVVAGPGGAEGDSKKQARVIGAIYAFRSIGHTQAKFNPLQREAPRNPRLSLERLGFTEADLDLEFDTGNYLGGVRMKVRDLLDNLQQTYCGHIGIEYIHIQETPRRRWLQSRIEPSRASNQYGRKERLAIYRKLAEAELFEQFLHTKYVGQKRFSLEGGEALITALDMILQKMPALGMEEVVMGMAHRGRLNVLSTIVGKSYEYIFQEFSTERAPGENEGDGDVKYHLGYDNVVKTRDGGSVEIRLAANPSHLEAVNSVVEGKARARQRIRGDLERRKVVPILIHGDAAVAGQGVVAEVLNFSQLKGYRTGGTIHLVVNNQIGFTTDPSDARSSRYCTDVAKMIECPIFHVNGSDPLAVAMAAELAVEYRHEFQADVFIDIYCWRKHGHNESDEPAFTQPLLYRTITEMPTVRESMREALLSGGEVSADDLDGIDREIREALEGALERAKKGVLPKTKGALGESNAVFQPQYDFNDIHTEVDPANLEHVAKVLTTVPDGFNLNRKIERQLKTKAKAFAEDTGIDWGFAEQLAFGTLMMEGTPVRLSGQDSERGTFSHRHAAFYDTETRERYCPLLNLGEGAERFCVYNSLLSEAAVLGFDFGYSLEYPDMLSIWEGQFGDFVNGAQVVIDQFIVSSESKWGRISGITLLLPHGYEGQGPEHSSARPERFLQQCAENNIQVCNLSTPAQYFHVLRRQMKRKFSKPLILMAPKSLLRHKECISYRKDFTSRMFSSILDDRTPPKKAKRVVMCSGKVFYDLMAMREEEGIDNAALVRVEQFYPLNGERLLEIVKPYLKTAEELVWCQEEPWNMGAWNFIRNRLEDIFGKKVTYAGRAAAASPSTGFASRHQQEQNALCREALGIG